MSLFSSFDVSASALTAQRFRMDLISGNIANVNTTQTEAGGPFRRQLAVFESVEMPPAPDGTPAPAMGVLAKMVEDTQTPFRKVHDPSHPQADADGYVTYPNVNIIEEMVNLLEALRSYQANLTVIENDKEIFMRSLNITA